MTDNHRRTISFKPLIDLRDRVARLENPDHGVGADLFRLFDGRSVIKTKRTIARFVAETDWLGLANIDEDVFASEIQGC
ncbi:hypothetical protein FJ936_06565 [Mesorhizobium sp. B2-4-13]|uniref:hypothetical protein n=1 Tax=Mesorhizobium sp. B2-4-13 TaxID=2589936 RepID=UPI00114F3065|nr:hypothetical protein [Mesorhizobium sp. B2-4-13]TPK87006.1 hypothetical protein FJ936_06565 [Mesorhizobium sp. B2-4-13]